MIHPRAYWLFASTVLSVLILAAALHWALSPMLERPYSDAERLADLQAAIAAEAAP